MASSVTVHDVALLVGSGLLMLVNVVDHLRALDVTLADYLMAVAAALATF